MNNLIKINQYLEKVGATDVKIFDLRGVSSLFDYVFIATVDVTRQAAALVDYISKAKKENEVEFRSISGEGSNWTLVDLNDILLNIFTYEERIHYDLERLYVDVPQIDVASLSDEAEFEVEYTYANDTNVVEQVVEVVKEVEEIEYDGDDEVEYEEVEIFEEIEIIEEVEAPSTSVSVDLSTLTLPGLKALAKQYGLKGYSTMKKAEILEMLYDHLGE